MKIYHRLVNLALILVLLNLTFITKIGVFFKGLSLFFGIMTFAIFMFYLYFNIYPYNIKSASKRVKILIGGYELLVTGAILFLLEIAIYVYLYFFSNLEISLTTYIVNTVICLVFLFIIQLNGSIRVLITSSQLGIIWRVLLLTCWWLPIIGPIIVLRSCVLLHREYLFEIVKAQVNNSRKTNEICKTKYPILLVHGIFFRDWQLFNYWGRTPCQLMINGAELFYGKQESATSIATSALELKTQILEILDTTGCQKINIIAHSKGGLDSRYAISCLNMAEQVASLTTINTPHHGCEFVDKVLNKLPQNIVQFISKKYNSTFKKLGDTQPDFYNGVRDLTAEKCRSFNKNVPNASGVLYQSITSKMKNCFSAGFPLNIGYAVIKHFEGANDGLVSVKSATWDNFLGVVSGSVTRGISHADMIDLMRQNIKGFDVSEFFVDLVKDLKAKGL